MSPTLDCWCRLPFDDNDGLTVDGDGVFVFVLWAEAKLSFCAVATNSYLGFV